MVKVIAFAGTLTHAGKYRVTAVRLGDVVDQFHDENCLADACTAEEADLAATRIRREQVDDLDAGHKDLGFCRLLDIFRSRLVDGAGQLGLDRTCFVNRLTDNVHDAAEGFLADRHQDGRTGVINGLTANETFCRVHGDGTDSVFAEVLGNFENKTIAEIVSFQRVQDLRQNATIEGNVDNSADNLADASSDTSRLERCLRCCGFGCRVAFAGALGAAAFAAGLAAASAFTAAVLAAVAFGAAAFSGLAAGVFGVAAFAIDPYLRD